MTANARRLAICFLALGTVALAACSGDPVSPTAQRDVLVGSLGVTDTTKHGDVLVGSLGVVDTSKTGH